MTAAFFPSTSLDTGGMPVGRCAASSRKFDDGAASIRARGNDESSAFFFWRRRFFFGIATVCLIMRGRLRLEVVHTTVVLRYKVGCFQGCTSGCKGKGACRSMCQSQLNWLRCTSESCKLGCDIGSSMSTRFPSQTESSDSSDQNQARIGVYGAEGKVRKPRPRFG